MSKKIAEGLDGLEENAVDYTENYDGQNLEPSVLPAKLPNILLNGSSGIAVGMATNIPSHNIMEYAADQYNDPRFEVGKNEWPALIRMLDDNKSIYNQ